MDYIYFYGDGEIIKGKTNKTKEDIENNLDEIINSIEIGKKYEIIGDDYNIRISPVNLIDSFNSTYVEFSICEQILRKQYKIPETEVLTILQIEIDKLKENSLTNQVEYEIYNEKKEKLDLSYCKNVQIKVNYEIKDSSLINKTMASQYSDIGIDIYNSKDSFFNDICYSYSNTNSDIILKDRVLDIYQNYSLCDNNCEYEKIDIETMTVKCSCNVKTEITVEVSEPVFGTIIEDSFKDSNFGVILCYNLVFNLDSKKNNIGFWIILFFILCNIILFILFFIYGIKSIKIFIYKEMKKNNYIAKIEPSSPLKKSQKSKKTVYIENTNIIKGETYNSSSNFNILKENIQKKAKASLENLYKKKIKKKNDKKDGNNKIKNKKIKIIKNPIMILKYTNKYYNFNNKISESGKNFSKNNKNLITYGLESKRKNSLKNFESHKKEIEEIENKQKCPGYYNLIQIDANNEKKNEPPESKYILDNYDYECAIKYEKRSFFRIYYICLLSYENILNTFFFKSALEIPTLKYTLFIFSYLCDLALNALFY